MYKTIRITIDQIIKNQQLLLTNKNIVFLQIIISQFLQILNIPFYIWILQKVIKMLLETITKEIINCINNNEGKNTFNNHINVLNTR